MENRREVKLRFRKDEQDLWLMVSSHKCMAGFVKDCLVFYRDNADRPKDVRPAPIDMSGVL